MFRPFKKHHNKSFKNEKFMSEMFFKMSWLGYNGKPLL